MLRLAPIVLLLLNACAHTALPRDEIERFFTCSDTTLKDAESNLARAGVPLMTVTDVSLTTGLFNVPVPRSKKGKRAPVILQSADQTTAYRLWLDAVPSQIVVVKDGENRVRYTVSYQLGGVGAVAWSTISEEQQEHEPTHGVLVAYRSAVCGAEKWVDRRLAALAFSIAPALAFADTKLPLVAVFDIADESGTLDAKKLAQQSQLLQSVHRPSLPDRNRP
jgi:hypothetical protein